MASQGPRPESQPVDAVIGLGANLGEPRRQIAAAFDALAGLPHTRLLRRSSLYRSAPLGKTDQPDFINAAALITTSLEALALLGYLLEIEHKQGRVRSLHTMANAPRTLDLDLLLYGDSVIAQSGLTVPHPRMHLRRFVLDPVAEIAPDGIIPGHGRIAELLLEVAGQAVEKMAP